MNNEKRTTPRRHGPVRGVPEKAKNFKEAIKRLIKELNTFKSLVLISLILAALGSVLSIFAPNKLKDLTNEITKGLVINTNNLEKLTTLTTNNFKSEETNKRIKDILAIKLDKETINTILISNDIKTEDKTKFNDFLNNNNSNELIQSLNNLPSNILDIILPDSTYQNTKITSKEKQEFLKTISGLLSNNFKNIKFPNSIKKVLFKDIEINNIKITSSEQIDFLLIMSSLDKNSDTDTLYKNIDKLPDNVKKVIEPSININKIKQITLFLLCLYLLSSLFTYIEQIIMTTVSNKFAKKLRTKISKKINKLPLKYFDNNKSGDILSRVTNDVDMIAQTMNHSLATLVSSITLFIGTIIMMFVTNYIMAITAIVSSLFGFFFMAKVLSKSQKYFTARQKNLGNLNGHIEEIYSGLNVVKVYNGKEESDKKFDELNDKLFESNMKSQFLSGLMMPMMGFIGNLGYVAVCIVGALLTMNDVISFGVIVAFMSYVRLFTSPLSQIAQGLNGLQSTAAASERVFEFTDEVEMDDESNITKYLDKDKVKGKIEFKNVYFGYNEDKTIIKNFNVKVNPGEKIAIVGPTGAGKTTMVNLLMKFYEINKGDIIIDGVSIKDLTRENIHDLFTMVLQDTWVFEGTVNENIIYNRENITEEKVKEVCKIVGLDHFIKTLPKGYKSNLNENNSISAGQKQLLTIARGMIENAPFLILDEATSNVDTRTEELVQNAMDKLMQGRTSFIIAHRLSTIKNADLILVMNDGNIIEQGNHEELLKKNGFYAELYNSQFEI